jgi:hypothetical protein
LCDYCDQESHTYCLKPQLTEIPEEAWYCGSCVDLGLIKVETRAGLLPEILLEKEEEYEEEEDMNTLVTDSSSAPQFR